MASFTLAGIVPVLACSLLLVGSLGCSHSLSPSDRIVEGKLEIIASCLGVFGEMARGTGEQPTLVLRLYDHCEEQTPTTIPRWFSKKVRDSNVHLAAGHHKTQLSEISTCLDLLEYCETGEIEVSLFETWELSGKFQHVFLVKMKDGAVEHVELLKTIVFSDGGLRTESGDGEESK